MEGMEFTMDGINERTDTSVVAELNLDIQSNVGEEPCEEMTFDSEDAARTFYDEYASRVGFLTKILSSRRSERDNSLISRGLGCRGFQHNHKSAKIPNEEKQREPCTAMLVVKRDKPDIWIVQKFVRDHNHPLLPPSGRPTFDARDKKIQELTAELRVKKRLSAAYKEQLLTLVNDVENHNDHLTNKVQLIRGNLKELEAGTDLEPELCD